MPYENSFENSFFKKVIEAIGNYRMLHNVTTVIAALSGGADSVSLLHFLWSNSNRLNISVRAAHVNHNLRGEESERDEAFVRKLCAEMGIPIDVLSVDIAAEAAKTKLGIEECGRQVRYDFFKSLTDKYPASVTATAHTASDNAETVLLNITRGCGLQGLCGIPPKRAGVIRPLINCLRSDIELYCSENKLSYVTDSTNLSDNYTRNKIRLNVIPQLRSINPSFEYAVSRLSALSMSDCEIIDKFTDIQRSKITVGESSLDISMLIESGRALSSHIIHKQIEEVFDIIVEKRHIDLILDIIERGRGAVEIKNNKRVRAENGLLLFESDYLIDRDSSNENKFEIPLRAGISFDYNGKHYSVSDKIEINCEENCKINKKLLIDCVSCDIISDDTKIRTRRSGDKFTLPGRGCTKTVKKLFSEMKLDKEDRDTRLLVANGSEVLWIEGIGGHAPAGNTRMSCVQIKIEKPAPKMTCLMALSV